MQYTVSTILARSKRGHAGRLILHSMSFLALCVAVLSLIYALYLYLPGKPVTPSVHTAEDSVVFDDTPLSPVSQFYPHMKFNHNTITLSLIHI